MTALQAKAHGRVGLIAESLHLDLTEIELFGERAQRADFRRSALGAQFDHRAAGEIDAEIHMHEDEQQNGDDRQRGGQRIAHAAKPHEGELGVLRGEAQKFHWL